jgi:urease accessory protein
MVLLVWQALDAGGRRSFLVGLVDPVLGLDHFIVLMGLGFWAGKLGDAAWWRLPSAFLIGAPVGFVLAASQTPSPLIDGLVRALVIGSMLLVAAALVVPIRLPHREITTTVAMIGGCHGYLHWLEIGPSEVLWWGVGAATASAGLMSIGVVVALALPRTG